MNNASNQPNNDMIFDRGINPTIMRDYFRDKVVSEKMEDIFDNRPNTRFLSINNGGAYYTPRIYDLLYPYCLMQLHATCIALDELGANQGNNTLNAECRTLSRILTADLAQVVSCVAIAAWLTVDDFRWHQGILKDCPEDLSYGLILQYPNAITKYAWYYYAKDERANMLKNIHENVLHEMKKNADQYARQLDRLSFPEVANYDELAF